MTEQVFRNIAWIRKPIIAAVSRYAASRDFALAFTIHHATPQQPPRVFICAARWRVRTHVRALSARSEIAHLTTDRPSDREAGVPTRHLAQYHFRIRGERKGWRRVFYTFDLPMCRYRILSNNCWVSFIKHQLQAEIYKTNDDKYNTSTQHSRRSRVDLKSWCGRHVYSQILDEAITKA